MADDQKVLAVSDDEMTVHDVEMSVHAIDVQKLVVGSSDWVMRVPHP